MPQGLYIDLKDGGPPMEITAGLRCPTFCTEIPEGWNNATHAIGGYVAGSEIVLVPKNCVYVYTRPPQLVPTIGMLDGYSVSGSNITLRTWWSASNENRPRGFPSSVWQFLPASSSGQQGLFIKDSTDFLAITNTASIGYCIWRGTVTVNGSWNTPTINGFDRNKYLVFADWSADGVVVDFDGLTVRAFSENAGENVNATVTLQIAIFANGAPDRAVGLSFMNAAGQCVFSTAKRPFVYENYRYTPSWTYTGIGDRMVMLGRYGYDSSVSSGWDYLKLAGLMRNGDNVRCGKGKLEETWTAQYSVTGRRLTTLQIPCIPKMY